MRFDAVQLVFVLLSLFVVFLCTGTYLCWSSDLCFNSDMSSSRRRASKRPAVDPDAEPEVTTFDPSKFLSLEHFRRYKKIEGRVLQSERKVSLDRFTLPNVTRQIQKRK